MLQKPLQKLSDGLARAEIWLAAALAGVVTLLILINVATRSIGMAIYWIDELAIYAMIWSTFLATSVLLKHRDAIVVTILLDKLNQTGQYLLGLFSDLMVLVFSAVLLWLCWRWFDPLTLASHNFDIKAFQGDTFNFVYSEKTSTLSIPKIYPCLIIPLFAISTTIHALNNLINSLIYPPMSGRVAP